MDPADTKQQMQSALRALQEDINSIRVGKAHPSLVEDIIVPAYGGTQRLKVMEMASIVAQDPQTLVITPWDKSVIGEITKAINSSNLDLTAVIDGDLTRIQIPPITEQRRQELIKILNAKLENGKIHLRQIRHEQLNITKQAFENKDINEDEKFNLEKQLQIIMDDYVAKADEIGKKKEEELKQV
jgi:ribosome recycling factor